MSLSALQPFMDSLVSEIQQLRSAIGAVQLDADSAGLASVRMLGCGVLAVAVRGSEVWMLG